jgi:hypothetical protein
MFSWGSDRECKMIRMMLHTLAQLPLLRVQGTFWHPQRRRVLA